MRARGRAVKREGNDRAHPDPRTFFSTPGAKSDKSNLTDGIAAIYGGRENEARGSARWKGNNREKERNSRVGLWLCRLDARTSPRKNL